MSNNIKVTKTNRPFNDSRIGIHLLNPTKADIQQAKEDARNKGFDRVFCHYSPQHKLNSRKWVTN